MHFVLRGDCNCILVLNRQLNHQLRLEDNPDAKFINGKVRIKKKIRKKGANLDQLPLSHLESKMFKNQ
jgi:hypothetical protein